MLYNFSTCLDFALNSDKDDILSSFKEQFHFPKHENKDVIYFCGNSLGLQPKQFELDIITEMQAWRDFAIDGYFKGNNPWLYYQEYMKPQLAAMMGCLETEITVMNTLTVNLHFLMLSFYKPTKERFKILMEAGAFPSDQYAVETLVKHFGLNTEDVIVEIHPKEGEKILHTHNIIEVIESLDNSLAMVMFGGMNYYTGQMFNMEIITKAAHKVGAVAGFDLAHVAGNIPTKLHDWNVDFAAWCSYKYLNAGPGAVSGIYIHEKYATDMNIPRLAGWWGNDENIRFKMEKGFIPKTNASGWNISTAQVFNMIGLKTSLTIFEKAGISEIRSKSLKLTAYLEYLLQQLPNLNFEIITPSNQEERGAQLSLYFKENGKAIHQKMIASGIVVDYREPGVIRVAPVPLYCSYEDVYRFYEILKHNF